MDIDYGSEEENFGGAIGTAQETSVRIFLPFNIHLLKFIFIFSLNSKIKCKILKFSIVTH